MRRLALQFAFGALGAALTLAGCADPLPCGTTGSSATVPGVSIAINTATCDVPSGTAVTFSYTTTVTAPLSFMTNPHAGCQATLNNPKSFIATEIVGTGSAIYCPSCDVGTCSEDPGEMITIPAGSYSDTLNWPGVQWDGPGESGTNPFGGPFPPGNYGVHVVFNIPEGKIDADLPITVD